LRAVHEEDLRADHLLSGFFEVDFKCLAPTERQVLLTVARQGIISEEDLVAKTDNESIDQVSMYVHGMNNLGYLQRAYSRGDGATAAGSLEDFPRWTIGNEFLRRWMLDNYQDLAQTLYSDVSDYGVESLLEMGRKVELDYLQHEIPELQKRLESLLAEHSGHGDAAAPEILQEIQELRRELERTSAQLRNLAD
jgi:hypothetical protein